jgi:hypothetical protein
MAFETRRPSWVFQFLCWQRVRWKGPLASEEEEPSKNMDTFHFIAVWPARALHLGGKQIPSSIQNMANKQKHAGLSGWNERESRNSFFYAFALFLAFLLFSLLSLNANTVSLTRIDDSLANHNNAANSMLSIKPWAEAAHICQCHCILVASYLFWISNFSLLSSPSGRMRIAFAFSAMAFVWVHLIDGIWG